MFARICSLFLLALLLPLDLAGQRILVGGTAFGANSSAVPPGSIAGRVTDQVTGKPIAGADIYLEEASISVLSDEDGRFEITAVPPGTYTAWAHRQGYWAPGAGFTINGESGFILQVAMGGAPISAIFGEPIRESDDARPVPLCDPGLGSGVRVVVRDILTGLAPTAHVTLEVESPNEHVVVGAQAEFYTPAGVRLNSGESHKSVGPFQISVSAHGYHTWTERGVHLDGLECRPPASAIRYVWLIPL